MPGRRPAPRHRKPSPPSRTAAKTSIALAAVAGVVTGAVALSANALSATQFSTTPIPPVEARGAAYTGEPGRPPIADDSVVSDTTVTQDDSVVSDTTVTQDDMSAGPALIVGTSGVIDRFARSWPDDTATLVTTSNRSTAWHVDQALDSAAAGYVVALLGPNDLAAGPTEFAHDLGALEQHHSDRCITWIPTSDTSGAALNNILNQRNTLGSIQLVPWDAKAARNPSLLTETGQPTDRAVRKLARLATTLSANCAPNCPTAAPIMPPDNQILANVYNATWRNGLAADTAWQLSSRNLNISSIANDPLSANIPGVAQVRHGPAGLASALAIALHVPGSQLLDDGRTTTTIDLVLGEQYTALATPDDVRTARDSAKCPNPQP